MYCSEILGISKFHGRVDFTFASNKNCKTTEEILTKGSSMILYIH